MRNIKLRDLIIFILLLLLSVLSYYVSKDRASLIDLFLIVQIPVFLAGFFLSPTKALIFGLIVPFVSSYLFGYPVDRAYTIISSFEFGSYAFTASLLNKKYKINVLISQIISMVVGRVVSGIVVFVLVSGSMIDLDPIKYVEEGLVNAWPGIILQLILIPGIMYLFNHYTTINLE